MNKFFVLLLASTFTQMAWAQKITVSGISAGAYMAQQFHLSYSSKVSGAALIAGGPFYCSQGNVMVALKSCMETERGLPVADHSVLQANRLARSKKIDSLKNLSSSKLYIMQGVLDSVIDPQIADVTLDSYKKLGVSEENIFFDNTLSVGHAFPTGNFGNRCDTPAEAPFISNCNRDVAGEILNHLLGDLLPRKAARKEGLYSFDQTTFFNRVDSFKLSMHDAGLIYVPQGCPLGGTHKCRIHISFHGCMQTLEDIKTYYATKTGFNSWAEGNNIIVLYPQAKRNFLIGNPYGCWDWWGYSSSEFSNKNAPQIGVIARIVEALQGGRLQLTKIIPEN